MPFTHSYSASSISASAAAAISAPSNSPRRHGRPLPSSSSSNTSIGSSTATHSVDTSSYHHAGSSSRSATTAADSPSPSEESSSRSRLFSSGRKSPDPFRRFRRLSSSNSLNLATAPANLDAGQSFDLQQRSAGTSIPAYPRPASSTPTLDTPRSAPPPLPSQASKPTFQRPKRTKSTSISILSSGLGLRSGPRDTLNSGGEGEGSRRYRKSASLSRSDVDFSSSTIHSSASCTRAVTPQPMVRASSPSPSFSDTRSPPCTGAHQSRQHKQAWYQAQQKTIELENPHNRGGKDSEAKLFPLNVSTASEGDAKSPRPVVETFLSEEEMLAAGIHVIRRRDNSADTKTKAEEKGGATPKIQQQQEEATPRIPTRLYGADHPDFLEFINSPVDSKQPSLLLEQLPSAGSLSHSHAKRSSGSISNSSCGSTDYLPHSAQMQDDTSSLHNGSTGSFSSGSKHSFSFAKLRRAGAGTKQQSSIPSTANSSNEDVTGGNRTFLSPRATQQQQQYSQNSVGSNGAPPGYLTPGPGSSASPFLNKHSATVGRASGNVGSARNGLAQVYNGSATIGPVSSVATGSGGIPPPKPPEPKPSLLAAFPRTDANTRPIDRDWSHVNHLLPPGSGDGGGGPGNGVYRNISHSRSQEAIAESRLDAEALRASASTPMPPPPPRRVNVSLTQNGYGGRGYGGSAAMGRTSSGGGGGVVGALGHVGQIGAAMGRRGWDFMKTLQSTSSSTSSGGGMSPRTPTYRSGAVVAENEATREWLLLLESPDSPRSLNRGGVFGAPLQDAVLRSRLSSLSSTTTPTTNRSPSHEDQDHLGVPDLGKAFTSNLFDSPRNTPRASVAGGFEALSLIEARHLYLPRLVVRCIESLEKWGPSEEGIYRISGRSSHTSKLRQFFSDPRNDLLLDQIHPADLDINSVCSLLKSYLRELPETLIPVDLTGKLDAAVSKLLFELPEEVGARAGKGVEAGGKNPDSKVAQLCSDKVKDHLEPLVKQLPVYNWYLLRELTHHLGLLAEEEVVARTKMPISNLTLVLAPTVSISLPLLQVLVRHREGVFSGAAPGTGVGEDVVAAAASALTSTPISTEGKEKVEKKKKVAPPKPAKPALLSSPSKLPVMVRKRTSSMGLAALLSSPTKTSPPARVAVHRWTPSTTPSLELAADIGTPLSSPTRPFPTSTTGGVGRGEMYERPSTSLGHFSDRPSPPMKPVGSRQMDALALDTRKREGETPIARYYARIREEAQTPLSPPPPSTVEERDGTKTPLAGSGRTGEMHKYWAEKSLLNSPTGEGRSGRRSALDRPRPPTSSGASFFAGRSRRSDSVNGLAQFKALSGIPTLVRSKNDEREGKEVGTKPLKIVKKVQGSSSSGSVSSVASAGSNGVRRREEKEEERKRTGGAEAEEDVKDQIRRYLEDGPGHARRR
ncbi:uncharacterized protein UBRO_07345 [Ustilago bromivora]|uniref:Rho-GAP domain-containing protein n=1 Tax=Ustilago bromivora TaxID=307758 RepID=A0A1K0GBH0_9BASI|nr:uncharacterized protein UBRO_07345 [Ustilago bromivora]SYW82553.1 uncharacterized protein UBRO2_04675 [Ustilago bromivora]